MDEFGLIHTYLSPLAGPEGLQLKDDAALVTPPKGEQLVITTDTLNEGVHFKAGSAPDTLAQKALRVNLSDLAAMGAKPLGYTLNLSLPEDSNEAFLQLFCAGLKRDQTNYNITLFGGDTTRTNGPLNISITAFGSTLKPLLRSGAKVGDAVYVSGQIGAGYLGLHDHCAETTRHYECPTPRLALGQTLRDHASACMDISDGLVQDLEHLCAASGVGAEINLCAIPLADPSYERLKQITGGDDYELLFTGPQGVDSSLKAEGVAITLIGEITESNDIKWVDETLKSVEIPTGGWVHF